MCIGWTIKCLTSLMQGVTTKTLDTCSIATERQLYCNNKVYHFTSKHYAAVKNHIRHCSATLFPNFFISDRLQCENYDYTLPFNMPEKYKIALGLSDPFPSEITNSHWFVYTHSDPISAVTLRLYELFECFWWKNKKLVFIAPSFATSELVRCLPVGHVKG